MQRERFAIRGIVQGVGFRPFVYRLASELHIAGWVRNDGDGVTIEAQAAAAQLDEFARRLQSDKPPLAQIDDFARMACPPEAGSEFCIVETAGSHAQHARIGPDVAICPACLAELFDPNNRRWRYAFINCTDCGPRFTLVRDLPYDRSKTSMSSFDQCDQCLQEYTTQISRRFHAEPNACPACGPQLALLDAGQRAVAGDAITETLKLLQAGKIVAIKGLGGFHLVCDARNAGAVATLRARKQRPDKPLAIMLANCASIRPLAEVSPAAQAALEAAARPIVLLPKRAECDALLAGIAPDMAEIGVMLPYTPIHYLLYHAAAGMPAGTGWLAETQPLALVMTSANRHGEPIVASNAAALAELADIVDAWLLHDREIVTRCDDSVLRVDPAGTNFIRRARGYVPGAIRLAGHGPDVLALGGFYKNTLCLTRGSEAFLSPHLGELDRPANCAALEDAVAHLLRLTQSQPKRIAHDLHPDFYSTQLAQRLAAEWQIPAIGIQHHHAHIGAVLAEHGIRAPVIGLARDGVGLGSDGKAWGGEVLLVDGANMTRLAHLPHLALPGGELAAREPWRLALAVLQQLSRADEIAARFAGIPQAAPLAQIRRQWPQTSSLGRWFDAAAGLLGVRSHCTFEGQAAMALESLARRHADLPVLPGIAGLPLHAAWRLLFAALADLSADEAGRSYGAALFHGTLIALLADLAENAARAHGLQRIAGSGGCWLNARLRAGLIAELKQRGLQLILPQQVPPGDGGLSLGQAWIARITSINA